MGKLISACCNTDNYVVNLPEYDYSARSNKNNMITIQINDDNQQLSFEERMLRLTLLTH